MVKDALQRIAVKMTSPDNGRDFWGKEGYSMPDLRMEKSNFRFQGYPFYAISGTLATPELGEVCLTYLEQSDSLFPRQELNVSDAARRATRIRSAVFEPVLARNGLKLVISELESYLKQVLTGLERIKNRSVALGRPEQIVMIGIHGTSQDGSWVVKPTDRKKANVLGKTQTLVDSVIEHFNQRGQQIDRLVLYICNPAEGNISSKQSGLKINYAHGNVGIESFNGQITLVTEKPLEFDSNSQTLSELPVHTFPI